jgi:phage terminase large subunit-like protein
VARRKRVAEPLLPSQRIAEFIETYCRVPEGVDVGKPLVLRPWQRDILVMAYDTPTRRAVVSMGRKNAKTALASCLLLTHLSGPMALANSQIYSVARSRDQASIVFGLAAKMIRMNPDLGSWVRIKDTVREMVDSETGATYRALSAEHSTAYGLSPVMAIHDELGQVRGPRDELYDAIETAMGAHAAPISWIISTQAPSDGDLLSVLIDDAATGADPRTKLYLRAAAEDDDPFDEATWHKANPALGDFLSVENMRELADRAQRLPSFAAGFRNLNLNMRVAADNHFLSPDVWRQCNGPVDLSLFEDADVFGGLDLSSRNDLTALVLVARDDAGIVHAWPHFWMPEQGHVERSKQDRVPYDLWAQQGHLTLTPGPTVNYDFVAARLKAIAAKCRRLRAIAYDRWRIDDLKRALVDASVTVDLVEHGQGFKDMSPAISDAEAVILDCRLRHGGHPVLTSCAANSVVTTDPAENRKLNKAKSSGRIDGMVALVMAIRTMETAAPAASCVYDTREVYSF